MAGAATTKRQRNKDQTRQEILSAALQIFAERGVYKSSLSDIAKAAGVSRATLFNYFAGRNQLVVELLAQTEAAAFGALERQARGGRDVGHRLEAAFAEVGGLMEAALMTHRAVFEMCDQNWAITSGEVRTTRLHGLFAKVLLGTNDGKGLRRDVDVGLLAEIITSTYVGLIHNWRIVEGYRLKQQMVDAGRLLAHLVQSPTKLALVKSTKQ